MTKYYYAIFNCAKSGVFESLEGIENGSWRRFETHEEANEYFVGFNRWLQYLRINSLDEKSPNLPNNSENITEITGEIASRNNPCKSPVISKKRKIDEVLNEEKIRYEEQKKSMTNYFLKLFFDA